MVVIRNAHFKNWYKNCLKSSIELEMSQKMISARATLKIFGKFVTFDRRQLTPAINVCQNMLIKFVYLSLSYNTTT